MVTHYQTLGIEEGAPPEAVRLAYVRLMRRVHPDRRPAWDAEAFSAADINSAYAVLKDRCRRAAYDDELARLRYPLSTIPRAVPARRFRLPFETLYLVWLVVLLLLVVGSEDLGLTRAGEADTVLAVNRPAAHHEVPAAQASSSIP